MWTIEKLENKLIDMRDLYQEWKEKVPEVFKIHLKMSECMYMSISLQVQYKECKYVYINRHVQILYFGEEEFSA